MTPRVHLSFPWRPRDRKGRTGSAEEKQTSKMSGYLINRDNVARLNEHFFPDSSLPAILCRSSLLLGATQHLCQLATKMSGMLAKAL